MIATLAGGEEATFTISLPENQTLEIQVIEQRGDAGLFSILAADGTELASLDPTARTTCVKRILIPAGAASIHLRPLTHGAAERVFEIRTSPLHPLGDQDRLRISGEQLLSEAERILRENGDLHAAAAAFEKSRVIWEQLSDPTRQAYALLEIGEREEAFGETKSAITHTQEALDLWTAVGDPSCRADALRQMADLGRRTGDTAKAEEHVSQALAISRSLGDQRDTARGLLIQGSLLESRGQTDRAGASYDEALTLARAVGRRMLEADALQFLGILEFKRAQWKESLEHFHAALAISQEEGDREMFGAGLSALASDYQSMGEVRKAIEYLDQALPIFRELSNMFRYSNALYNLGNSYQALDDYPKAIGYYREALPILSKMNSPLGQAYILMAMGHAYRAMGDDDRADSYFRQATGMWRKTGEKQGESFALNASAALALQSRNYSQAIDLYQQSLAISHDAGFQRQESSALAAISEVYMTEKDAHHSLDLAIQAGALADKIGAQQQRAVALYQEGRARRALHDYAAAREALEQANALMGVVGSRVQQTNVVFELAALDRDTGSLEAGRDRILKSLDSLEQTGASVGSAESRMLFAASHRKSFDLAVDIEMQMHETGEALELSERARARELVDLIRGARLDIRQGADPRLLDRERRVQELLDAKHDRLMRMLEASHAPALEAQARKEIDELLQQYRDTEDEIRRQSPRYGALIEPRVFSLGDLQAELPGPDTALIEFWLGQERSYAWLVTKKSVEGFELPTRDAIESAARRAYASLDARNVEREESLAARKQRVSEADREFAQSAAELSKMLLGPIQGISGMRRLWVVSDGALEYLPFAALPMPGAQTPLVATHEILRLPSASVMAEMSSEASARRPAPLSVAVFADPVFRADDERVANVGARQASDPPRAASDVDLFNLPRLYFSRQEADAIRTLGGGEKTREILDFDASRVEAEKPSLRDYRVIHFATHALLDSKNPELSGLVLSMIDRQGRPQDGFLRLHEIYNLKLNADLVVLSACRTALGPEVQGEGLIGLTRGFMYAGAPQVLASLWSIRDNATTWFMTKFYEALLKRHQTPEAALRAAQLAMMKDSRWSQPYYWAAFTVQGAR